MPQKDPSKQALEDALTRLAETAGKNLSADELHGLVDSLLETGSPATFGSDPFTATPVDLPGPLDTPVTFTVRLDLKGAKPPIWRRLELPGDLTLDRVNEVIQIAMGWAGFHLHRFELPSGGRRPGPSFVNDDDEDPDSGTHEATVRLDQVLRQSGDTLIYEYDFGDGWEHALKVEDVSPRGAGRIRCTGGRRAGPPEDCGGLYGYAEILDALQTPSALREEWAQERIDWLPAGFDPKAFDAQEVDDLLTGWEAGDIVPGPPPPPKALLPLLTFSPYVPADLQDLIDAAQLGAEAPEPSPETAAELVEPWMVLLREIGDGLTLTQAGYLPPASVKRIFEALHLDGVWIGKGNREDQTLPVAELRSSAQALGLIRKRKGALLPTRLGQKYVSAQGTLVDTTDPIGLLRHIIDQLPLSSSQFGSHAAPLLMLCVAAGAHPGAGLDPVAEVLTQLGWRTDQGAPVPAIGVRQEADLTYAVLDHLHTAAGGDHGPDASRTPDVVRDLARRALRDDPDQPPTQPEAAPSNVIPLRSDEPTPQVDPASLEMDPEDLAQGSAEALVQGIAEARQALHAELVLCTAIGSVRLGIEGDEQEVDEALTFMLGQIIEYAESIGSPDALGLLRVASVLGPEVTRSAAQAGADRLATQGVKDRPWAARVGAPTLRRAWRYGDHLGMQESVGVTFDYRGREHTVMVLIDHQLGGGVKDVWLAEGKQSTRLHDDVRRELLASNEAFFEDIDGTQAADVLEAALDQPPCPEQEDQIEDVALHLGLLRARTQRLRELAGGA